MKLTEVWNGGKKKSSPIGKDQTYNAYYENISAKLGILQVVLYLSLFAFVVLFSLANTRLITYQTFYHFFQDLNASAEQVDIFAADTVSYPTAEQQSFSLYRKGLAVAGNQSVTVFSATGRQLVSHGIQYQRPVAVGSGKYLLVYEKGGTQYSLYNANTQMYEGKTEYPIQGATVSDSGSYALISASASSTSSVYLYNNRFALIGAYHKKGYVMNAALSADGKRLALLTLSTDGGQQATTVLLAEPGRDSAIAETVLTDAMGLSCSFTESGRLAVLCSKGVAYIDASGDLESYFDFEEKIVALSAVGKDGIAVCLKKNTISPKNIVIVFDKNGKMVYNKTVEENLTQLSYIGQSVYWSTENGVSRLDLRTEETVFKACTTDGRVLLAVDRGEVLLCSPQKAVYISFSS